MAEKKNFILRLDPDTYKALETWAANEFRSVNGQIEYLLNHALLQAGRKVTEKKKEDKSTKSKKK